MSAKRLLTAFQAAKTHPSKFKLKNGRMLYYNEYGAENGFPVIHFHGSYSSRLELVHLQDEAENRNLRFICPDRPGVGLSDIDPNITYESYSYDTAELIEYLNIKPGSFGFSGQSQGGSYVLSNLYYLKKLKPKFGTLISSVSQFVSSEIHQKDIDESLKNCPDIKLGAKLCNKYPPLFYAQHAFFTFLLKYNPSFMMKQVKAFQECKFDNDLINNEDFFNVFSEAMQYSIHKHGVKGWIKIQENTFKNWGFNLKDIDINNTKILSYHGADDKLCPLDWQQLLANKLNYEIKVFDGKGHLMFSEPEVYNTVLDDIKENTGILKPIQ